jgi:1-acyl-sn-glycerol-3-phosphate acyltransferase
VGISGSEQTFPKLARLQRAHIVARFGPMFTLPPLERDNREEQMKQQTDEIMCRIAALLPESYRGFYADHPRLKELLDEQSGLAESRVALV